MSRNNNVLLKKYSSIYIREMMICSEESELEHMPVILCDLSVEKNNPKADKLELYQFSW